MKYVELTNNFFGRSLVVRLGRCTFTILRNLTKTWVSWRRRISQPEKQGMYKQTRSTRGPKKRYSRYKPRSKWRQRRSPRWSKPKYASTKHNEIPSRRIFLNAKRRKKRDVNGQTMQSLFNLSVPSALTLPTLARLAGARIIRVVRCALVFVEFPRLVV